MDTILIPQRRACSYFLPLGAAAIRCVTDLVRSPWYLAPCVPARFLIWSRWLTIHLSVFSSRIVRVLQATRPSSNPVRHICNCHNVLTRNSFSSPATSVSPPCIHCSLTASMKSGCTILTSGRCLATYLYLSVSIPPTIRCVTSEVRSCLCSAPICTADLARRVRASGVIEVQQSTSPARGRSLPVELSAHSKTNSGFLERSLSLTEVCSHPACPLESKRPKVVEGYLKSTRATYALYCIIRLYTIRLYKD
jgi:hypothetical protein